MTTADFPDWQERRHPATATMPETRTWKTAGQWWARDKKAHWIAPGDSRAGALANLERMMTADNQPTRTP